MYRNIIYHHCHFNDFSLHDNGTFFSPSLHSQFHERKIGQYLNCELSFFFFFVRVVALPFSEFVEHPVSLGPTVHCSAHAPAREKTTHFVREDTWVIGVPSPNSKEYRKSTVIHRKKNVFPKNRIAFGKQVTTVFAIIHPKQKDGYLQHSKFSSFIAIIIKSEIQIYS